MIDPSDLHQNLVEDYLELLLQFKTKILKFTHLKENCCHMSENMSITCLVRDIYDNEERYTFWWNHFQKSENHILELLKIENTENEWTIHISSSVYQILDESRSQLITTNPVEIYANYISLYYANSWFSQLVSE